MRSPSIIRTLLIVPALTAWCAISLAEDFRVETKLYDGAGKEPVSQATTLFKAGRVYDYLSGPPQVALFDKPRGRFRLLDIERKVQTEISTEKVLTFSEGLQTSATKSKNSFLQFAANPTFEPKLDDDTGELTLSSQLMTYRVETEKHETGDAVQQYREFSDWYARLNAMMNPGSQPPFPRLAVNSELAKRGLLAKKVNLVIPAQLTRRGKNLRSEHRIHYNLLPRDLKSIDETDNQLATFKQVDFKEFIMPGQTKPGK
jgi:hypothetical protein